MQLITTRGKVDRNLKTIKDLHPYQVDAIATGVNLKEPRCLGLILGTGLGKTVILLTIIDQLLKRDLIRGALIVAPKKAVFNTWRQEAQAWAHTRYLKFGIIHGDAIKGPAERARRLALFDKTTHIKLINYEGLIWLGDALHKFYKDREMPFDLVGYDESTMIKHSTSTRFVKMKAHMGRFTYRFIMTGTPIPNGLADIFGQMYALDLGASLGSTLDSFRSRFLQPIPSGDGFRKWIPLPNAGVAVTKRIRNHIIYMKKEDYLQLPPITYNPIQLDLPPHLQEQYEELEQKFFLELDSSTGIEAFNSGALSMKLRQFLQGSVYMGMGRDRETYRIHSEKLQMLQGMVDLKQKDARVLEGIGNCIIAYTFQFEREDLQSIFPSAPAIDGHTSANDAARFMEEWNQKKHKVLLYNPASSPHGLNLQFGGNQILWYSQTWNLEHYIQLNARLWRQRQEKPVFVHHLIFRNTLDQGIFERLTSKDREQTTLLSALRDYQQRKSARLPPVAI